MGCEEIQTHLADHLAGTLPPHVAEAVAAHLRSCHACAKEAEGVDETWQALGSLPAVRPDSNAMRARFDAMLAGYQEGVGPANAGPRMMKAWPPPARYAIWMSAAAAALLLGVVLGRQTATAPALDPQIASLREELRGVREMMTLSLLQQQSASERLKGVTWTREIDQPGAEVATALVDALMHDPNDNVRLATVDALKRFADSDAVRRAALEALPRQTSPMVQVALIDFVLEVYGRDAAPAVRRLAMDPMVHEAVRARAEQGLARLGA